MSQPDHNQSLDLYRRVAWDNLIYKTEVGSGLHGITIPGTDDVDEMGVCIPEPEYIIGSQHFEQYQDRWHSDGTRIPEGVRSGFGDIDQTIYGLRKYARLAAQGNPTVLLPLYAPPSKVYVSTELGDNLRANRDLFLSKQAGHRFHGYLVAQRERAQSGKGSNRPELVEKFGYDTKMMYHALRLAIQGTELMAQRDIMLPMNPAHVDYLLAVRNGRYTLRGVLADLDFYTTILQQTTRWSTLPEHPDYEELDDFIIGMHYTHWKLKGLL